MVVKTGSMQIQEGYDPRKCCHCDSIAKSIISSGPVVRIIKCSGCGLMRQASHLTTKDKDIFLFEGAAEHIREQVEEKEKIQIQDHLQILNVVKKYFPNKGDLLEIGCSTGELLNEIRKYGWSVTGVEPQKWSCLISRNKYNLDVINSTIYDAGLEHNSYDVILLIHVIEHLPDPFEALKFIKSLLKPGGILVIETPRYDTLTFKILKGRERSVIPGHLYYFTRKSLLAMTSKVGYDIIKHYSVGRTVTVDRLSYYLAKYFNSLFLTKYILKFSKVFHLEKIRLYLNMRDMVRLYVRN